MYKYVFFSFTYVCVTLLALAHAHLSLCAFGLPWVTFACSWLTLCCVYIYKERERERNERTKSLIKIKYSFHLRNKICSGENHWADLLLSTQPFHCHNFFAILFFSFLFPSLGSFISRNFGLVVVIVLSNTIIQNTTYDSTTIQKTTLTKEDGSLMYNSPSLALPSHCP